MASKSATVRLDLELLAWVDAYAELRGSSRTKVFTAALKSFRADTERGVPDLEGSAEVSARPGRGSAADGARVAPSRPAPPRVPGVKTARELYSEQMMERQARLNKQRGL